jgi:hypothetical protein
MSKHDNDDYIERLVEYQKHTLDPGFYTGGNIHPVLRASRPNRYGWMFIFGGLTGVIIIVANVDHDTTWWQYLIAAAYLGLYVLVGIKLLSKSGKDGPRYRASSHHRHRRTRKGHP